METSGVITLACTFNIRVGPHLIWIGISAFEVLLLVRLEHKFHTLVPAARDLVLSRLDFKAVTSVIDVVQPL